MLEEEPLTKTKAARLLDTDGIPYANLKPGGKVAILAGCGPMGLVAIDLALHGEVKPSCGSH